MPFDHKKYAQLQIITRNRVMKDTYESLGNFLDKNPGDYMHIRVKLVRYKDIEKLVDESEKAVRAASGGNR